MYFNEHGAKVAIMLLISKKNSRKSCENVIRGARNHSVAVIVIRWLSAN